VATTAGLAPLLQEGIGDTIRASLTPLPNGDRTEVIVSADPASARDPQLHSTGHRVHSRLRAHHQHLLQDMADQIQTYLRDQMPKWKTTHPGVEAMKVAVMGCVVNGPGEVKHSISASRCRGPSKPRRRCMSTAAHVDAQGDRIVAEFLEILNEYARHPLRGDHAGIIGAKYNSVTGRG
jgi:(E)-4-hydroxy-3-methylbut-2-enyl-diphosphate synthase